MKKFNYYNPTKLINGKESHKEIGTILNNDQIKSVLLVYGKHSIKKSGLLDEITDILNTQNIKIIFHSGVSSNPILSHANAGVKLAKENNVDAILAIGGGSVVDESKGIAAGALREGDVWDLYTGTPAKDALPLYAILTLSATGSEMNSGSVLTNEKTNEKFSFGSPYSFPKVSIINPELTYSLPMDYLAYSAVDIITHTVEVYFTAKNLPLIQKRFMENLVKTVIETTEKIILEPTNYEARAEFSLAATWALNSLTMMGSSGFSFPNHMIEHSLSALYNIPHGAGLAVVLPAWMKYTKAENNDIYCRFAHEIFGLNNADEAITSLENWFHQIGAPIRLKELKIEEEKTMEIAENAFLTSTRWGMAEQYSISVIHDILKWAL